MPVDSKHPIFQEMLNILNEIIEKLKVCRYLYLDYLQVARW